MEQPNEGRLLRIYIGETDKHDGKPLFEWLIGQAREQGLAGATVLRGLAGYGAHMRLHTAKILRMATDLPVVVEIVDSAENIEAFLPIVEAAVSEGLVTIERVEVRFYRAKAAKA